MNHAHHHDHHPHAPAGFGRAFAVAGALLVKREWVGLESTTARRIALRLSGVALLAFGLIVGVRIALYAVRFLHPDLRATGPAV
ncbi:MAG: hypothetical protein ABSF69_06290 [Polyangiaceae bacterium]|jgi:hypothetical protein